MFVLAAFWAALAAVNFRKELFFFKEKPACYQPKSLKLLLYLSFFLLAPSLISPFFKKASMLVLSFTFLLLFFSLEPKAKALFQPLKGDFPFSFSILRFALPFVLCISTLIQACLESYYGPIELKQEAVRQLLAEPSVLILLSVVIFSPLVEEFLFRVFLQGFLRRFLSFYYSSFISSVLFSLAHLSWQQSLLNFSLLPSLFFLSLFLAFSYEKEQRILPPFLIHASFNLFNTLILLGFK